MAKHHTHGEPGPAHHGHAYKGHKHSGHSHQGRVRGHEHTSYVDGHGTSDPLAEEKYRQMNAKHGMHGGMSPQGEYENCDEGYAGGDMADNIEHD